MSLVWFYIYSNSIYIFHIAFILARRLFSDFPICFFILFGFAKYVLIIPLYLQVLVACISGGKIFYLILFQVSGFFSYLLHPTADFHFLSYAIPGTLQSLKSKLLAYSPLSVAILRHLHGWSNSVE